MKYTYQYVSDFAVVMFTSPEFESSVFADAWAEEFLDAVVRNSEEYYLNEVFKEED